MKEDDFVNNMVIALGSKKNEFLDAIESKIYDYIRQQSPSLCLSFVTKTNNNTVKSRWYPAYNIKYVRIFVAFVRKKKYNDDIVDSILTDKIVDIVSNHYDSFYTNNINCIAQPLSDYFLSNNLLAEQFFDQIIEYYDGDIPSNIRGQIAKQLVHYMEDSISTNVVHNCAHTIQQISTTVIAKASTVPIISSISHILTAKMALMLKLGLAKILATSTGKTILLTVVKKAIITKIITIFAVVLSGHIGGPLLLAGVIYLFIKYEMDKLPAKMAKKISKSVRNSLSNEFENVNKNLSSQIVKELSKSFLTTFALDIAKDDEIKGMILQLCDEIKTQ